MRSILSIIGAFVTACAVFAAAPASAAQPGILDGSFGGGVIAPPIGSGDDYGRAVALQPDGKIVVAGYCGNGSNDDFCLARYQTNGVLDASFGTGGTVISPIGSSTDRAYAVAVQPDGKIIVAGYCTDAGKDRFCLARYQANGSLDPGFGASGKVIIPIGSDNSWGYALALQPDGKIVVAGSCGSGLSIYACIARYQSNGALDTGFGASGKVISTLGSSPSTNAIALQSDGKIVVAGYCDNGSNYDFCLIRHQPNGSLDNTFGTGGKVISPIGSSDDVGQAIALQPDGKIVVAGTCWNGSDGDLCVARLEANGATDYGFGFGGKVVTPFGSSYDYGYAIALQPDGKIVVAGACSTTASGYNFCLVRYRAIGALDPGFGPVGGGKVTAGIGSSDDYGYAMALQPDGKIVVAGRCVSAGKNRFCLARFHGGPFDAKNCSMDIDGDGVVLSTTDALLLARTSRGMTGAAVINGISFASHATRKTWPDIRDYLVSQCGMTLVP